MPKAANAQTKLGGSRKLMDSRRSLPEMAWEVHWMAHTAARVHAVNVKTMNVESFSAAEYRPLARRSAVATAVAVARAATGKSAPNPRRTFAMAPRIPASWKK